MSIDHQTEDLKILPYIYAMLWPSLHNISKYVNQYLVFYQFYYMVLYHSHGILSEIICNLLRFLKLSTLQPG